MSEARDRNNALSSGRAAASVDVERQPSAGSPNQETQQPKPRRGLVYALLIRAVLLSVAYVVVHLFGLRAYTSLLSGTGDINWLKAFVCLTYLSLHAAFYLLVPVLLIAALLLKGMEAIGMTERPSSPKSD